MTQLEKTLLSFLQDVAAMRQAQQHYFKTRSKTALDESKRKEAGIDSCIREAKAKGYLKEESPQSTLFK